MKYKLFVILFVLIIGCKEKIIKHPINDYKNPIDLIKINYFKDSVDIIYKDNLIFRDVNQRMYSRDNSKKNIIYSYNPKDTSIVFFNFTNGVNLISLKNRRVKTKKLPHYRYSQSLGDTIVFEQNKILYLSKLYSIIYDSELNVLFLPYEFMENYKNNKFEQVLEVSYTLKENILLSKISYLENFDKQKDTVFSFNLNMLPPATASL